LWVVDKSAGGIECKNVARKIVNLEYYEQVGEASIEGSQGLYSSK
jgi:hypothetical protein